MTRRLARGVALAAPIVLFAYGALALSYAGPRTPLSPTLDEWNRRVSQQFAQNWRLFSPDLSQVDTDVTLTLRGDSGGVSQEYSLSRLAFDASVRGWRRVFPSRLARVLETEQIFLSQCLRRAARVRELRRDASRGDMTAKAVVADARFRAAAATNRRLQARIEAMMYRFANYVARRIDPNADAFRIQMYALPLKPTFSHLSIAEPDEHLDAIVKDIESQVAPGVIRLFDSDWKRTRS